MIARTKTVYFCGIDVPSIQIKAQVSLGFFCFLGVRYISVVAKLLVILLINVIVFNSVESWASQSSYCLSRTVTKKINDIEYHHSIDFEGPKSAVDRSGWSWINMSDFDGNYDFIQSPQKEKITKLPELYSKPCLAKEEFFENCQRVGSIFSKSTGAAFIDGYSTSPLGLSKMESYAISGDRIIKIPSSGSKAPRYRGDIPSKKMAAVSGSQDELIIFDGVAFQTVKLEKAFPRKDGYTSWAIANDPVTKRDFVISNGALGSTPFLYEIMDGPAIAEIGLDKNIDGPLSIFTIAGDHQTWIIERDGIYAEEGNFFRRVAHRSSTTFITAPAFIGLTDAGDIYLQLETNKSKKVQAFLLQNFSKSCDIPLDLNRDIELNFVE